MAAVGAWESLAAELAARPRRWLVTGAAGFIGSHLVQRLLALDQEVRGLDDFSTGRPANLEAALRAVGSARAKNFEFRPGSVCLPADVERAMTSVELVLHQAGLGSVPRSLADPARTFEVNVGGTWTVLVAAQAAGVRRVVLASSSSVYGDAPELPQREDRIGQPLSPYAASKRAAELVAEGFARSRGLACVALRYFNVFGPRQDPYGPYAAVIPRWCAALLAGEAPRLEGDGGTTRDFTPVAAVVRANLLAATRPLAEPLAMLNVGTGRETRLDALFDCLRGLVLELGRGRPGILPSPAPPRPGDRRASRADLARARQALGYEPPEDLVPALRATLRELVDSSAGAS